MIEVLTLFHGWIPSTKENALRWACYLERLGKLNRITKNRLHKPANPWYNIYEI